MQQLEMACSLGAPRRCKEAQDHRKVHRSLLDLGRLPYIDYDSSSAARSVKAKLLVHPISVSSLKLNRSALSHLMQDNGYLGYLKAVKSIKMAT